MRLGTLSVAISGQLNAVLYLCGVHKSCPLLREKTVPAVRTAYRSCTSLAPRPIAVVFGLGTRLRMCMRTKVEIGVLRNREQPQML